jgi:hypothetical protein
MKGRAIPYSDVELQWLSDNRRLDRKSLHAGFVAKFGRHELTVEHLKGLCARKGWKTGRTGQFKQGHQAYNKGKEMPFNPNSAACRFKKGHTPHNTNYLGHERITRDGYVEISVDERDPYTGFERRYVLKHRWLWEKANGPLPDGYCLKCLDGTRTNTDPSNWEAIPRAMLPRLAGRKDHGIIGYDAAPKQLKPVILAVAKLDHAQREKRTKGAN